MGPSGVIDTLINDAIFKVDDLDSSPHTPEGCNDETHNEIDYSNLWTKVSKYGRGKHPKKTLFR